MSFEVFEDTRSRTREFISVTDNKTFGLPRTFLANQGITSKHKAVILYDADEMKIALHFTLSDPKFGLTVRIPHETQGGMIFAKSFFDLKRIDVKKYSQRYDFEKVHLQDIGVDKNDIAYVIQLKENKRSETKSDGRSWYQPEDVIIEDIDDKPIDLSEIPF
jgi:hypothetical protein